MPSFPAFNSLLVWNDKKALIRRFRHFCYPHQCYYFMVKMDHYVASVWLWGIVISRDGQVVIITGSPRSWNKCLWKKIYAIARICRAKSPILSVCLSVCLSVTRVYCIKTAERIIKILSLSYRPIILVFRHQGSLCKSEGVTPVVAGAKYKGLVIFDQYAAISRKL